MELGLINKSLVAHSRMVLTELQWAAEWRRKWCPKATRARAGQPKFAGARTSCWFLTKPAIYWPNHESRHCVKELQLLQGENQFLTVLIKAWVVSLKLVWSIAYTHSMYFDMSLILKCPFRNKSGILKGSTFLLCT